MTENVTMALLKHLRKLGVEEMLIFCGKRSRC